MKKINGKKMYSTGDLAKGAGRTTNAAAMFLLHRKVPRRGKRYLLDEIEFKALLREFRNAKPGRPRKGSRRKRRTV